MTDRKYICAFTELGSEFPHYMNISQYGEEIEVTVRDVAKDGKEGQTIAIRIPAVLFGLMLEDANKNFKDTP